MITGRNSWIRSTGQLKSNSSHQIPPRLDALGRFAYSQLFPMRSKITALAILICAAWCWPAASRSQTGSERNAPKPATPPAAWPAQAVRGAKAMVASDEPLASAAGVEILKKGGNAVDAAVAVGFALAVVGPRAGNLGGGGFMLVRLRDGRTTFLDFREVAPGRSSRDMYILPDGTLDGDAATIGYRSVGIPGTVAGLELALKKYGKLTLAQVMAPAMRLAEQGFPVSEKLARELAAHRSLLERFPMSKRIFLKDGALYQPGDARWEVISSPPPSSGGVAMIEALNMLDGVPLKSWDDAQSVHMVAETMRRVFADRAVYLADPDFAHVPVQGLTDPRYARELFASIDALHASSSQTVRAGNPAPFDAPAAGGSGSGLARDTSPGRIAVSPNEGHNTTHYSVVDAAGNAVATTYTLNNSYGSGVTCSAGFLLNDEMDDFTTQPGVPNKLFGLMQSEANAIAPGKRPLSSMTPTILLRNGKLSFVTGSPGGPTIISVTLLSVLDWMRLGMEAQAAINAPRFHHQWLPDTLF